MISLQEIVDFAKVNKIDYGTDIIIVTEAYKALLKAKGLEEPDNSGIDKKDVRIVYDKVENKYYYDDWDDVNQKAVTDPIPENMIEMVKNCIKDFENDK